MDRGKWHSEERPIGIHENPVNFTWFFQFCMKSIGECIGVLEMACKRMKHKKNIALFSGFSWHFSAFLASLSGENLHALGYCLGLNLRYFGNFVEADCDVSTTCIDIVLYICISGHFRLSYRLSWT